MKRKLVVKPEIEDLSDDVLLEIFEYFDKEMIESGATVCRR
jgi:hypothetical protein